jgi:hypothetical protein
MAGLVTVFSRNGTPLADLRTSVTRSWVLNGIGRAEFMLATNDPKCTRENIEFGNLVLVQHETLPDWIGVIHTPRQWFAGAVLVTAYEIIKITQWRRTPENQMLTGTAGQIFSQLIDIANSRVDTRLRSAVVSGDGTSRQETLSDSVWAHINRVRRRSNNDWLVNSGFIAGRLAANMTWRAMAGDAPLQSLVEGYNIEFPQTPLAEDGEIYNDVLGQGEATTSGERIFSNAIAQDSISRFGLREIKKLFDGNSEQATLDTNTMAEAARVSRPIATSSLVALNVGQTFAACKLGNTLNVQFRTVGFGGSGTGYTANVRIYGMRYADNTGKLEIQTQESADGQF